MATDRQVEANRRNATRSTGPRSPEGKARSRRNALTHGLTAGHAYLLPHEDREEFEELRDAMFRHLAPDGPLEHLLVERIVALFWRLRRIPAVEAALFEWVKEEQGREYDYEGSSRSQALEPRRDDLMGRGSSASREVLQVGRANQTLFDSNLMGKIARYEPSLQRQLSLTLKELREAQANRPNPVEYIDAPEQTSAPEPVTLPDQDSLPAAGPRIIRRSLSAPVVFDHEVEIEAGGSLADFAGLQDDG